VLCVSGTSRTGKTHFVDALGHLAIDRRKIVNAFESTPIATNPSRPRRCQQSEGQADPRDRVVIEAPVAPSLSIPRRRALAFTDPAYGKRSPKASRLAGATADKE
jgi:hypothetical protein